MSTPTRKPWLAMIAGATFTALWGCDSGDPENPASFVAAHGGLQNAQFTTDDLILLPDRREVPQGTVIAIPASLHDSLLSELASAPVEEGTRAAWQIGGSLKLVATDGSETYVTLFRPIGVFHWGPTEFIGQLPSIEQVLSQWADENQPAPL